MKNVNKKRRIASALAILSTVSAMAMPISTLTASADEAIEEIPAIVQETTVAEDEDCGIESLGQTEENTEEETEEAETVAENTLTEKQKIRNYFEEEFEDFDSDAYAGQLDYTHESNFGVEKRGRNLLVTRSEHVDQSQERNRLTLTDTNSVIYPGALVKADNNLAKGTPRIIDIDRGEMTIRVEYGPIAKGEKRSRTTTLEDLKDSMADIEDKCLDPDSPSTARYTFNLEKINSDEQLRAKAHLEQSVYGNLKLDAETGIGKTKQVVLLDYYQIYYTISADMQTKEKLFADNVTLKDVQKKINRDNPAAIVTSVDYGRRVVACIETDDTSFDLRAEIEGSGLNDKIKGSGSLKINNKLSKCNVKYYVYGGSGANSGKLITCIGPEALPQLVDAIATDTAYQRNIALPVSYTTSFVHDGATAKVNFSEDYYVNKTETLTPTAIDISSGGMFRGFLGGLFGKHGNVDSHTVKLVGKRITDLDENGEYVYSPEETIYEREFTGENIPENNFKEIPSDYDLSTVRVYFDYDGYKKTGFKETANGIKLVDLVSNPADIKNVNINIRSEDLGSAGACYRVYGKVKVTDKSGNTREKQINDCCLIRS